MNTSADACEFVLGHASIHRRHGDPFPLPRLSNVGRGGPLSPFHLLQRRVDASARTLNHLAAVPFVAGPASARLPLTQVQQWIMDDLHRWVALYGECPDDITEDSVMGDLGQRSDLYNQEAKHLVGIDLSIAWSRRMPRRWRLRRRWATSGTLTSWWNALPRRWNTFVPAETWWSHTGTPACADRGGGGSSSTIALRGQPPGLQAPSQSSGGDLYCAEEGWGTKTDPARAASQPVPDSAYN